MALTRISPERYFAEENAREERAEYFDGEVVMMAGAATAHERVLRGLASPLYRAFEAGTICEPFAGGNIRVRAGRSYVYPDLVVACDPIVEPLPSRVLVNPILVAEVLSPSTEAVDRGAKYLAYREIETLREYLLVHVDAPIVEVFRRVEGGWLAVVVEGEDARLRLTSLGFDLDLGQVFRSRIQEGWTPDA